MLKRTNNKEKYLQDAQYLVYLRKKTERETVIEYLAQCSGPMYFLHLFDSNCLLRYKTKEEAEAVLNSEAVKKLLNNIECTPGDTIEYGVIRVPFEILSIKKL